MTCSNSGEKINCPKDLNQYLICEPIFENTFSPEECESRKFYGDCYHCFASAIAKRDRQIRQSVRLKGEWINERYDGLWYHTCSRCNTEIEFDRTVKRLGGENFCRNCGADMRGN